jgi:hypothetical protein
MTKIANLEQWSLIWRRAVQEDVLYLDVPNTDIHFVAEVHAQDQLLEEPACLVLIQATYSVQHT